MPELADPGATQLLHDAERIHAEFDALLSDISAERRYPTEADERRLKELRRDRAALLAVIETLMREDRAIRQALQERLGRDAIDGDEILVCDEARAAQIIKGFGV